MPTAAPSAADIAALVRSTPRSFVRRVKDAVGGRLTAAHLAFNVSSIWDHVPRGAHLLDIGAWDGRLGACLAETRGCTVLNVDVVDKNETTLPFEVFDGRTLPCAAASFDRVLLMYVLHHSANDADLLREAARVCRPDGRVLIAEDMVETLPQRLIVLGFHLWLWLFTGLGWKGRFRRLAAWEERFAAAGLAIEQVLPLGRHMGRRGWPHNVLFVCRPAAAITDGASG